jgi:hypothetical protein
MDVGGLLVNTGTMSSIGSPTIPNGATIINSGTILGNALNISGTLIDAGAPGYIGMVGTCTINGTGTFIPGGSGIGATTVKETSISDPLSAGTMRILSNSTNIFKVDPGSTPTSTKLLSNLQILGPSQGTVQTNGGVIVITNVGATPFAIGQVFKLFGTQPSDGVFGPSLFTLNTTNSYPVIVPAQPASGMAWDLSQVIFDGIISITNGPVILPTTPTNITTSVAGNVLTLSWPSDYTGWLLQVQTNSRSSGLGTNWFTVPGSSSTNSVSITNDLANPCVFFRMAYP